MKSTNLRLDNAVISAELSPSFDKFRFFRLAPVTLFDTDRQFRGKLSISYLGQEGVLVSIRLNREARGIRPPNHINAFGEADFQYIRKNYNIKFSEKKLTAIGCPCLINGREALEGFASFITMVEHNWRKCRSLAPDEWNRIEAQVLSSDPRAKDTLLGRLLLDQVVNFPSCEEFLPRLGELDQSLWSSYMKEPIEQKIEAWTKREWDRGINGNGHLAPLIDTIRSRWINTSDILRMVREASKKPLFVGDLMTISNVKVCNGVYSFKLLMSPGCTLNLDKVAVHLDTMGLGVNFHNCLPGKRIKAVLAADGDLGDETSEGKFHKFTIRSIGNITQNSPTQSEDTAKLAWSRFMESLPAEAFHSKEEEREISASAREFIEYSFAL